MLIVLDFFLFLAVLSFLSMLFFLWLHAFLNLFFLSLIAHYVHEVDNLKFLILSFLKNIFNPFVGLAANIDENISLGNLCDISSRWLVAVKVNALV